MVFRCNYAGTIIIIIITMVNFDHFASELHKPVLNIGLKSE